MPASLIGEQAGISASSLPVQLLDNLPGKVMEDGSMTWIPTLHVVDLDGMLGPWLGLGPALAVLAI